MSIDFAEKMAALGRAEDALRPWEGPGDLDRGIERFLDDVLGMMDDFYSGEMGELLTLPWPQPEDEPISLARRSGRA